jgi:inner membrane transporter RhtA
MLVVLAATSLECGGALAKTLFPVLGPAGTVTLRVGFAAVVLLVVWRPRVHQISRTGLAVAALFGLALAAMNLAFYLALSRVPLGVAVTIELAGPLSLAALGSRRPRDLLWVALAAVGILGFAPLGVLGISGRGALDPLGLVLSLLSGVFCAAYVVMSAKAGRAFSDGAGLALAMTIAAIVLLPIGIATAGPALLQPRLLLAGAGVALLASVAPYSLEIEALRRMPTRVYGVLVSVQPGIAAIVGWVVLHEQLSIRTLVAIAVVTVASAGGVRPD